MTGKIMFNEGASTRTVYEGRETLIDILVENADTIWVCGRNGTLLRGNSVSGFQQMPGIFDRPRFTSMARFNGMLYLASEFGSPIGLFTYSAGTLRRVSTGLDPEVEDVHSVDTAYGVLWTIGMKDIRRFEGMKWERISFLGNDPVR